MSDNIETDVTQSIELSDAVCDGCGEQAKTPIRHADTELVYCFDCILNGRVIALTP